VRTTYFFRMHTPPSDALLSRFAPLLPVDTTGIVAHQAPDFFALWEALEKEAGHQCDVPFWAAVWPGARLLARYILHNSGLVAGKSVLDLGAGGAVVAIAAARSGAKHVVANDTDPIARAVAVKNSCENNESFTIDDHNFLTADDTPAFDIVFLADMFYEESTVAPLLLLLRRMSAAGAQVFIADGNRPFTPKSCLEPVTTGEVTVDFDLEGCGQRTVTLYRFVAADGKYG
jgi:predicted nicotinamide N-methyase